MTANSRSPIPLKSKGAVTFHARTALIALAVLAVVAVGVLAALWVASFFLYASLRVNPLHAGLWAWLDALFAWRDAKMPNGGKHLVGAALLGVLGGIGGPAMGLYTVWARSGRRRLFGSARFASEAEIRAAGLL